MTVFCGAAIDTAKISYEPIFNPLSGLAAALRANGVSVAPLLWLETGARLGLPGVQQFAFTSQEDFPEVAAGIAKLGKVVRFLEMAVPKNGVFCAQSHRFEDIWARYVAAYHASWDQNYGRWDILVEPLH